MTPKDRHRHGHVDLGTRCVPVPRRRRLACARRARRRWPQTLETAPWAVAACGRYARVALTGAVHLSPARPRLPAGTPADPQPVRQWRPSADPARSGRGRRRFPPRPVLRRGLGILDPSRGAGRIRRGPVTARRCCSCANAPAAPTCRTQPTPRRIDRHWKRSTGNPEHRRVALATRVWPIYGTGQRRKPPGRSGGN